jgi:hypothetical protein
MARRAASRRARAEILWLGGKAGCTLSITDKIIEARTEAGCFRSKLLDYVFPTYDHIIPPVPASTIEADSDVLMAALARLVAVSHALGGRPPIVGLAWPGEDAGTATLELVREEGIAADAVAVTAVGAGAVALPAVRFGQLIDALALKRVRISPTAPVRVDAVDDGTGLLAVMAAAAWPRAAVTGRAA